jgi:hypothetical protein
VADINIQEKRGPGIWPWIIGALVLVLIVWGVTQMTRDDHDAGTAADQPGMTAPAAERAPGEPAPGTRPGAADPGTTTPGTGDPGAGMGTGQGTGAPGTGTGVGTGTGAGTDPTTTP